MPRSDPLWDDGPDYDPDITPSKIVDEHGHIIDPQIAAIYRRLIAMENFGAERGAERFLEMVLKHELWGEDDLVELCKQGAW